MAQKGLLVKHNNKVVHKLVFAGNTTRGITEYKAAIDSLNPAKTLVYEEYDDTDTNFTTPTVDETEKATLNWE